MMLAVHQLLAAGAIAVGASLASPQAAAPAGMNSVAPAAADDRGEARLDRTKAVPRKRLLKRRRLELAPVVSLSVNDALIQHYAVGGDLIYYLHDAFGLGLGATYVVANVKRAHLEAIRRGATAVLATFDEPRLFAHADGHWVPLVGKLSVFDRLIVHFDGYVAAGFGLVSVAGGRQLGAASFALGQRYVLGDWLALRVELRDHVYLDTQRASDLPRSDIQNHLLLMIGISAFVPPWFEYSYE